MSNTIIKEQYPYKDKTLMAIPFDANHKEDNYKMSVKSLFFSSTTGDMAKWFEQLRNFKILSKESVKILSEKSENGNNIQSPLGHCEWERDEITEHSHHGSTGNYECIVRRFKQDKIAIVIMTNQNNGNVYDISEKIYSIVKKDN